MTNAHSKVIFTVTAAALSGSMLLLSTVGLSAQERTPCYEVTAARGESMAFGVGSILLNKCTGEAWVLMMREASDGGTAVRWLPIKVGDGEAGWRNNQPNSTRR
jgi:hypothetical protein